MSYIRNENKEINIKSFFSGMIPKICLLGYYGRAGFKLSKETFFVNKGLGLYS